jgi:hypothetical protein
MAAASRQCGEKKSSPHVPAINRKALNFEL